MDIHKHIYDVINVDIKIQENIQNCVQDSFSEKDDYFNSTNTLLESNMNP